MESWSEKPPRNQAIGCLTYAGAVGASSFYGEGGVKHFTPVLRSGRTDVDVSSLFGGG